MATNRGPDGSDRIIGPEDGSNDEGAIFALTFTAIDTIVIHVFESTVPCLEATVHPLLREETFVTTVRGGIHERGEWREQVDA
jgi:hypothetical protein